MKKIILLVIICLSSPVFVSAQNNMEDVVYLKNGNVLRGIIMEQIPNKSITLKINEKNTMVIKFDEIEKITKEAIAEKPKEKAPPTDYKQKGFIDLTELTYGYGVSTITTSNGSATVNDKTDPTFGLRTVNGYQFNPFVTLGLGLGYEQYGNSGLIPITLDTRIMFSRKKIAPVLNLNGGYAAGVNNSGGFCLNPALGLRIFMTKKAAFIFNLGYKMQQLKITSSVWDVYGNLVKKTKIENFNFLTLSLGVSF